MRLKQQCRVWYDPELVVNSLIDDNIHWYFLEEAGNPVVDSVICCCVIPVNGNEIPANALLRQNNPLTVFFAAPDCIGTVAENPRSTDSNHFY